MRLDSAFNGLVTGIFMFQVQGLYIEGPVQGSAVLDPVKVKGWKGQMSKKVRWVRWKVIDPYHMAVQSKWTIIHFEGLNAKEWAYSAPSRKWRNSGQMKAVPA